MELPQRKIWLVPNLLAAALPKRTRHSAVYPANYTGYKLSYYWVSGYWLVIFHIACEQAHLCKFSLNSHKWACSRAIFCIEPTFYHGAIWCAADLAVVHGKEQLFASKQWEVYLTMSNLISITLNSTLYVPFVCVCVLYLYREMCVRFADLERKLGEIDRARAIYMHASQLADPRVCIHISFLFESHFVF